MKIMKIIIMIIIIMTIIIIFIYLYNEYISVRLRNKSCISQKDSDDKALIVLRKSIYRDYVNSISFEMYVTLLRQSFWNNIYIDFCVINYFLFITVYIYFISVIQICVKCMTSTLNIFFQVQFNVHFIVKSRYLLTYSILFTSNKHNFKNFDWSDNWIKLQYRDYAFCKNGTFDIFIDHCR